MQISTSSARSMGKETSMSDEKADVIDVPPTASRRDAPTRHFNRLAEDRYQLVLALYLIRKNSRGKYGLFQPDFISIIFGRYFPHSRLRRRTDADMRYERSSGGMVC